jgi:hypothetical protein
MKPKPRSVFNELMEKKDLSYEELFNKYTWATPVSRPKSNRQRLSLEASRLVNGAYRELTGMHLHVNRYYLAESMTEAICCAEALGL